MENDFTLTHAQFAHYLFFDLQSYEFSTWHVIGVAMIRFHSLFVLRKCVIGHYRRITATASLRVAMGKDTGSGFVLDWLAASPASRP